MKKEIHPKYKKMIINCACGNIINIFSTLNKKNLNVDVCFKCHPFYTGKQRVISQGGRIEQFNKKFSIV
ncbi:50S ribosomal protein L31 [Buchnera aphidicola]|uniref:50S ribosomal protein L31 n=1 Tax=Buchnera aphidicola TaxID=9 RepID=UPI0031B7FCA1